MRLRLLRAAALLLASAVCVQAAQRTFLMGTSIAAPNLQFSFDNLPDKDLVSLPLDDFIGIPWAQFETGPPLPAAWVSRWTTIQTGAAASGKILYLAVSPLSNRITLTSGVDNNGNMFSNWAPVDS